MAENAGGGKKKILLEYTNKLYDQVQPLWDIKKDNPVFVLNHSRTRPHSGPAVGEEATPLQSFKLYAFKEPFNP